MLFLHCQPALDLTACPEQQFPVFLNRKSAVLDINFTWKPQKEISGDYTHQTTLLNIVLKD